MPESNRELPRFVYHDSFEQRDAGGLYDPHACSDSEEYRRNFMPDEVTRDTTKRMHYCAWRAGRARTAADRRRWMASYYELRDRVVVGNRKLIFRAVRKRLAQAAVIDDLIGECDLVLIHVVAAFNPWLGIRFSTYAFTCLMRALSRIAQRMSAGWAARAMPLEHLPNGEPEGFDDEPEPCRYPELDQFLRADHPLLSEREKAILTKRFCLKERTPTPTLEKVGRDLGLSKERVRQVQEQALGKLRGALAAM